MVDTGCLRTLCIGFSNTAAQKLRRAGCGTKNTAAGAVGHGEGQALLIGDDPAYSPTPKNRVVHEALLLYRDIVSITYDQAMRTIKVAARFILRDVGLIVINVGSVLARARGVQLVGTQRTADIVFGLRVGVSGLEIEPAMQSP